jgi:hypothetical protein
MNANGRRCKQFANNFRHLAKKGRPIYKARSSLSTAQAIARERAAAARQAAMKSKKK